MAWIDALFKRMVELEASDLHMTSTRKPMFRLHGDMVTIEECPELQPDQMKQVLYDITPAAKKQEFEKSGTLRGCDVHGRPLDPNHPWNNDG